MLTVSHSVEFICNINLREEYIKLKDKKQKTKLVKNRTNKENIDQHNGRKKKDKMINNDLQRLHRKLKIEYHQFH
jgi:chromosome condensin MukBEF MukE localization factor